MKTTKLLGPRGRTTLRVAVWILGLIMIFEVLAIGWAIWRKRSLTTLAVPQPPLENPVPDSNSPPPAGAVSNAAASVISRSDVSPGTGTASMDVPLPGTALYFLESALSSRERGDMKAALAQLRAANDVLPQHPRLLYELAKTYEKMALPEKAAEAWDQLFKLGPGAGHFFKVAAMKFEDGVHKAPREIESTLQLGKVLARRADHSGTQEQMTVRIPVEARDGAVIEPSKVHVDVVFFDLVGDQRVEPHGAEATTPKWLSGTPRWLETPVEFLELTYDPARQPRLSAGPAERRFYGYVIKLYYNDQLQDVIAEPKQLAARAQEPGERPLENAVDGPPPSLDDSLFPLPIK